MTIVIAKVTARSRLLSDRAARGSSATMYQACS